MSPRFYRTLLISTLILSILGFTSIGCASATVPYADRTEMRVATIQGPAGIGMVQLMEENEKQASLNRYDFLVESSAQNLASLVISGQVDIACVPTNLAATLYNKTDGDTRLAALYTLGMLYVIENGNTITQFEDLRGKTLHVSGQGSVPQYAIEYVLDGYGLTDEVEVIYYADHDELAALAASGSVDLCMLPEPKVTAALAQNPDLRVALDVTEGWAEAAELNEDSDSVLTMGGVVIRAAFLDEHPDAVKTFLSEYKTSVEYATDSIHETSLLVEKFGIMPNAAIAEKAIPNCNIAYLDGEDMVASIRTFYEVLFASNPQSIGGLIPLDDFYYVG